MAKYDLIIEILFFLKHSFLIRVRDFEGEKVILINHSINLKFELNTNFCKSEQ